MSKSVYALNWLYLDLNSYFATIEQQVNTNYRNKPIAVVPCDADTTCAIAASYEAKAKGVTTGTIIRGRVEEHPKMLIWFFQLTVGVFNCDNN